ncbi:hypothetical protein NDU88_002872 [Pleurodeles waltl]|uniref:Uncharacterized protein n=1 Tax=Pleurodeles waltl TaxID=8319 RepID=A0AAV7SBS8_PLEWA|nr:hypothetical protein NDU88_002872 [Pleurodeles waltl]
MIKANMSQVESDDIRPTVTRRHEDGYVAGIGGNCEEMCTQKTSISGRITGALKGGISRTLRRQNKPALGREQTHGSMRKRANSQEGRQAYWHRGTRHARGGNKGHSQEKTVRGGNSGTLTRGNTHTGTRMGRKHTQVRSQEETGTVGCTLKGITSAFA